MFKNEAINARFLGSREFREEYRTEYAYVAGGMYRGIASPALVITMGRARLMSFFGTGGLSLAQIEQGIRQIQQALRAGEPYGMNFLCYPEKPQLELNVVRLYLQFGIDRMEASGFTQITPALVLFRLSALKRNAAGKI